MQWYVLQAREGSINVKQHEALGQDNLQSDTCSCIALTIAFTPVRFGMCQKSKRCCIGLMSREVATQHPKGKERGEAKMVKNRDLSCLKPLEVTG